MMNCVEEQNTSIKALYFTRRVKAWREINGREREALDMSNASSEETDTENFKMRK